MIFYTIQEKRGHARGVFTCIFLLFCSVQPFFSHALAQKTGSAKTTGFISKPKESAIQIDSIPPVITFMPPGGSFNRFPTVQLSTNEKATIYYTTDGTTPSVKSALYAGPFSIITDGRNVLKCIAEDLAGNFSKVDSQVYAVDTKPPLVTFEPRGGKFNKQVWLRAQSNKSCRVYYAVGNDRITPASRWFVDSLSIDASVTLTLIATDKAGNTSPEQKLRFIIDRTVPVVTVTPAGGVFNKRVIVALQA